MNVGAHALFIYLLVRYVCLSFAYSKKSGVGKTVENQQGMNV